MNLDNWREWAFIFCMIALIQFVILTSVAMLFYTGGTHIDSNAPGYSFWHNFFSDLGRTKAYSGRDNTISYVIFIITFSVYGSGFIFFAIALPYFFTETKSEKWLSIIVSFFFILTGILYVGIAFTPGDIYYNAHVTFVQISGLTGLIGLILYIIVIFKSKAYPNRYAFILLILLVASNIYMVLTVFAVPLQDITSANELIIWTAGQKIMIYLNLICSFIILYGAWKLVKS